MKIQLPDEAAVRSLAKCLPALETVKDRELAAKVTYVWEKMLEMSKWNCFEDAAFKEGREEKLVTHVNAVTESALAVSRIFSRYHESTYDEERIIVLGLLHDADKVVQYEPGPEGLPVISEIAKKIQHGVLTAMVAGEAGIDMDMIHLILTHTPTQNMKPQFRESMLFNHIDLCNWEQLVNS